MPEELKKEVEELLSDSETKYADVVDYLSNEGISISVASVCRYAQRLYQNKEMLNIANENFKRIGEELDKYPELDTTEAILRVMSNQLFNAISKLDETHFDKIEITDLMKETISLVRASSYKKRIDLQNKEDYEAALEKLKALVFETMAKEEPELYAKVVEFLNKKKKEGLNNV